VKIAISHSFSFHAAHTLPWHPGKCARPHGHSYLLEVRVDGELDEHGIIMDFDDLAAAVTGSVLDRLDHTDLNDLFESPTAENIAAWIFAQLDREVLGLQEVRLWETTAASAVVSRE